MLDLLRTIGLCFSIGLFFAGWVLLPLCCFASQVRALWRGAGR